MKPTNRPQPQSWNRIQDPRKYLCRVFDAFVRAYEIRDPQVTKVFGNLLSASFGSAVKNTVAIGSKIYANPSEHLLMQQCASFVKKFPLKDPSLDPISAAWEKFQRAEHMCKRTNQRLTAEKKSHRTRYSEIREVARQWIARVIGPSPDLPAIYERCDFGPGASVGIHGTATHRAAKLESDDWTVTPTAAPYAMCAMSGEPRIWELLQDCGIFSLDPWAFSALFDKKIAQTQANKIIMVPKTALVHRTIAIEPLLNGFVQKGVDLFLRGRLRRFGIDLSDQNSNSELARLGSLDGFNPFSTIDLSSASDSVSIGVVKDLLPPDWFWLMNNLRSPAYESEWGNGRYHKFVSMGNGFCFPLETLIFASLAYAVGTVTGDTEFRVYGDDIIVRQRCALLLIEVLNYLGFQVNKDKTFIFGPFKESCGADFFEGVPVRPYSLDFLPRNDGDVYKVFNGMLERHPDLPKGVQDAILAPIPLTERMYRPSPGPAMGAATVPLDVFMGTSSATWEPGLMTWSWREFVDVGKPDKRRPSSATEMYGALLGQRSSRDDGRVEFTFRRRVKRKVVVVPGASHSALPPGGFLTSRAPFLHCEWRIATSPSYR